MVTGLVPCVATDVPRRLNFRPSMSTRKSCTVTSCLGRANCPLVRYPRDDNSPDLTERNSCTQYPIWCRKPTLSEAIERRSRSDHYQYPYLLQPVNLYIHNVWQLLPWQSKFQDLKHAKCLKTLHSGMNSDMNRTATILISSKKYKGNSPSITRPPQ